MRVAEGSADLEACFLVRKEVFVGEQGVPEELEYDAYDAAAVHVLAAGPDGPLGTGRLVIGAEGYGDSVGKLGRLAVRAEARGLGVGVALVRGLEEQARVHGCAEVVLGAQIRALGFYERLGYAAYGPEFDDAGIAHRAMRRSV
ncbi:GNAT family N-acetyltransferase [Streptomyces sp. T-3]|nr:GNAT family N-acetyltransferase [Streptomyces sp. T-3]